MKSRHRLLCAGLAFLPADFSTAIAQTMAPAQTPTSFSFMLPRTVLDVTITYSYADCYYLEGDETKTPNYVFKTVPTVSARAIPDNYLHVKSIETAAIANATWADNSFSITTFPGTHILSSVGTHATDETSQIVGNVLTGVVKLVSVAFPFGALAKAEKSLQDKSQEANSAAHIKCNASDDPNADIKRSKEAITALQKALRGDPPADGEIVKIGEGEKPQDTMARIQALQNLMTQEKDDQIITIKATVDPGYTEVDNTPTSDDNFPAPPTTPSAIRGIAETPVQIASFSIPKEKLKKVFSEQIKTIEL